ncbi:MAG TPA: hypothetical protein VJV78_26685 [Polyangiales bacterium]|nr:hypothetical protein [Polyangiales bacterium]
MVQRSDDKGDKRSPGKSSESGASRDAEANAANALRERIRQAHGGGSGAATARASDHAPAPEGLLVPSSSIPPAAEHSGVRTRPPEPRATSITPPLFGPPKLTPGAMSVPWPAVPRTRPQAKTTRMGLGAPVGAPGTPEEHPPAGLGWGEHGSADESEAITADMQVPPALQSSATPRAAQSHDAGPVRPGTPRGIAPPALPPAQHASQPPMDNYALSTARTQPMPRVRGGAANAANAANHSKAAANGRNEAEVEERRRVELATTRKTQGLLRAPESSSGQAGRYSVHDVSTEYVDSGMPEPLAHAQTTGEEVRLPDPAAYEPEPNSPAELEPEGSRPRRSTPKQRVGHRRSTRPEIGHARERGTKRTDPGIRARTLRGNVGPLTPLAPPASAAPPPAPQVDPGTVLVDPSLSLPPQLPAATPPVKTKPSSGYVPLPRDREAYEAFLRSAAGEHGGPPRARPSWAQQETALIPRDALELPFEYETERTSSRGVWLRSVLGLVLILVSGATLWWTFFREESGAVQREHENAAPGPGPQQVAGKAITLIATEPSGAEVLLERAVIGNTPLEVTRPTQGEALYIVRLKNFEQQMVRITSVTHSAIHITLTPVAAEQPAPPPAAKR